MHIPATQLFLFITYLHIKNIFAFPVILGCSCEWITFFSFFFFQKTPFLISCLLFPKYKSSFINIYLLQFWLLVCLFFFFKLTFLLCLLTRMLNFEGSGVWKPQPILNTLILWQVWIVFICCYFVYLQIQKNIHLKKTYKVFNIFIYNTHT